jgi:hypothetical protein
MLMDVIGRIVLTDSKRLAQAEGMITTAPTGPSVRPASRENPRLIWRPELPDEGETLSVAELAECCCPDLCDRDHANE